MDDDPADPAITREFVLQVVRQQRPTASDIADGIRLYEAAKREEEAQQSSEESIVRSWFRRRWKRLTAWASALAAASGIGWKAYEWVMDSAERAVLERQVTEKQAHAVEAATKAVEDLDDRAVDFDGRIRTLETTVGKNSALQQILVEIQLSDPRTKRIVRDRRDLRDRLTAEGIRVE